MRLVGARLALVPVALYLLALGVRLVAIGLVPFPGNEVSAWYAGAARHLAAGDGFISGVVWSYATPPLTVPRPAFELWLPMSSLVSAAGMLVLGSTYAAGQLATALLGATLAPLSWAVGRAAARMAGLEARHRESVALASGALAAVLAPFVLATVDPDSTTAFAAFGVGAALLVPAALAAGPPEVPNRARILPGLLLGVALGLAYLSRQEAAWIGLCFLVLLVRARRAAAPGHAGRWIFDRTWPVVLGGAVVVLPWLARDVAAFGSPFPGATLENVFLRRNLDVYAFLDRPSLGAYLAQGLPALVGDRLEAAWHQLSAVVVVPAFPVGLVGLLGLVALRRSAALRGPSALVVLLLSGALTFVATALLFPVATLWGTFQHSAGPLTVGLIVVSALWLDALVTRLSLLRGWRPTNVILAPLALLALSVPITVLSVLLAARASDGLQSRYTSIARALRAHADATPGGMPAVIVTDHPAWLASVLDVDAVALPDEEPAAVARLGQTFGAPWLVVVDDRGRYPAVLATSVGGRCTEGPPITLEPAGGTAVVVALRPACAGS